MAEPQKEASSAVNTKEKDTLLDLDFGNDFLSSWKATSITGNDSMDLDFGPISKGKKKAFKFNKEDIEFNLDSDFGKIPSFNIDMPDLDISSPIKKDVNSKEKQNEDPTSGSIKAKADRFSFAFDFTDFDSFSFKPNPRNQVTKGKKDKATESSSDKSGSKESADHPPEESDSHDDETTRNLCTQEKAVLITSSFDSHVGDGAAAGSATGNHLSNTNDGGLLNSTAAFDIASAHKEFTTFDKTMNINKQQLDSPLHKVSPEQVSREACIATEAAIDVSVYSASATESSRNIMSELQEDVNSGSMVIKQGDKQSFNNNVVVGSFSSSGSPVQGGPSLQCGASSQNTNGQPQNSADIHSSLGNEDGAKHTQFESLVGQSSTSMVPTEFTADDHGQMNSQNLLDLSTVTLSSGATARASNLMPEREKEAFTARSKYFKAAEKSGEQFVNALNQPKLSSLSEKRIVARQQHHGDERQCNANTARNDSMLAGKSLAHLESLISEEHSDRGSQKGSQGSLSSRVTSQTEKLRLENAANSKVLAPKIVTVQNKKILTSEGDNAASLRANFQIPRLSFLKTSRPTGGTMDGSTSIPQENIKPLNVDKNRVVVGGRPSIADQLVRIENHEPPIHSLKRKRVETPNMNAISKSPKHVLQSPVQGQTEENPMEFMEEAHRNKNNADNCKTSAPDGYQSSTLSDAWEANLKELDIPYLMEKDRNVEKAEAYTKELENICNMLRKKHEEAKEILVRAIVCNNKLLMLNHPLHDEKIRMVQRFAKQLSLKEIDTQTS